MLEKFSCPVCEADEWEPIGRRTYNRVAPPSTDDVERRLLVLFELWLRERTQVLLTSLLCTRCGMIVYRPRPPEHDLHAKYQFLYRHDGTDHSNAATEDGVQASRARHIKRLIAPRIFRGSDRPRVLDFGGLDGRLVVPLARRGAECWLVDYYDRPLPGVRRAGDKLEDLPESLRFDAIVCSHVLEHVAAPLDVLRRLGGGLKERGVIYLEVPHEVWRRAPLAEEPVTHVNFFIPESLRTLIQRSGLHPTRVRERAVTHPGGHRVVVIEALAEPAAGRSNRAPGLLEGVVAARRLLNPSLPDRLLRAIRYPHELRKATARWTRHLLDGSRS